MARCIFAAHKSYKHMKKIISFFLFLMAVVGSVILARPLMDDTPNYGTIPVMVIKVPNPKPIPQQAQTLSFKNVTTSQKVSARVHLAPEGLWVRLDQRLLISGVMVKNLTTGEMGAELYNGYVEDFLLSFPLTSGRWEIVLKYPGLGGYRACFIYDESNPWFIIPIPSYNIF